MTSANTTLKPEVLGWVNDKAVYPNDVLYVGRNKFKALRFKSESELYGKSDWLGEVTVAISDLSWETIK